ncbi:phage tail family protein [Cytobacillus spongiae]|uniref:phage distal tail protein n=1 Tax=Cytobacillus spongiae TaxID=2901381 RepID=UPI001F370F6D|nr:phage tail domain-containing protein [Cytobacillus spongiae]UII56716.1 phage tail family protein [Cytobacillus spongiae]
MRVKELICTNQNGDSLLISNSGVYRIQEEIDTTGAKVNVNYGSNFRTQGSTAISSRIERRDFPLLFYIEVSGKSEEWIQSKRDEVFKVFNPIYNPIKLQIKTEVRSVYIEVNVELTPSITPGIETVNEEWHDVLVQLSAGSPFFKGTEQQKVEIAVWEPLLEFLLEIPEEGIEIGRRSSSLIVNVLNYGQVKTGMIIQFKALGTVVNPSLFNVNSREYFKLNTTMTAGEVITINTNKGKKRIESVVNGVTTIAFNTIDHNSKFMQLEVGDNLFRYDADTNVDNLEVSIYFSPQYIGV